MAKSLKLVFIALTLALLVAIAVCALSPSSYMTEIPFIPTWLATWADANPNFRNFPVFAAFAALLFLVVTFYQRPVTRYGRWRLAFGAFFATALLGALLEAFQLLLPGRWADPMDVTWMTLGAFAGAFGAASLNLVFCSNEPGVGSLAPSPRLDTRNL